MLKKDVEGAQPPEINLDLKPIKSQIIEWKPLQWSVQIPTPLPLDPCNRRGFTWNTGLSAIYIPLHSHERTSLGDQSTVYRNYGHESESEKKLNTESPETET